MVIDATGTSWSMGAVPLFWASAQPLLRLFNLLVRSSKEILERCWVPVPQLY